MRGQATITGVDWFLFALIIVGAAASGIKPQLQTKRKKNNKDEEQETATNNSSPVTASVCIVGSLVTAPMLLGIPGEIYYFGTMISAGLVALIIAVPLMTHIFFDRLYSMKITNLSEYIEKRFSSELRSTVTVFSALTLLMNMGVFLYVAAIALSQATVLNTEVATVVLAATSIGFTFMLGPRSPFVAEASYLFNIVTDIPVLAVFGAIFVGGGRNVWAIASQGSRIIFDEISGNLTTRYTWWTQVIGGVPLIMVILANQGVVEKLQELSTKRRMFAACYLSLAQGVVFLGILFFIGITVFANLAGCDPLMNGEISVADQVAVFLYVNIFQHVTLVPGVSVALIVLSSLRSLADGVVKIAELLLSKRVKPVYREIHKQELEDKSAAKGLRVLIILCTLVVLGIAYLVPLFGPGVLQISLSFFGAFGSPVFALYLLGFFVPFVNNIGAFAGLCISTCVTLWMTIGAFVSYAPAYLPLTDEQCYSATVNVTNTTESTLTTSVSPLVTTISDEEELPVLSGLDYFFGISYMWYSLIGILITSVVAITVSCCTVSNIDKFVNPGLTYKCCFKETNYAISEAVDSKTPTKETGGTPPGSYSNPSYQTSVC